MSEEIKIFSEEVKKSMQNAVLHLETELSKVRAGKANPQMFESIKVECYGTFMNLKDIANINTLDARTVVVQPHDRSIIGAIEKAIINSNLGVNPKNETMALRLSIPPLTEERRRDLVKKVKEMVENGKINIRNIRRLANETAKKFEKKGIAEDLIKKMEKEVQDLTDVNIIAIDKIFAAKEKDIMTI